jgi:outer membrane protein assembly factor BamB
VKQIVDLENYIVVLVGYCSEVGERNVFCYNASGQLKWQIPNPVQLHEINYYTGIYIREQQLYAYSVSGVEYNLNEETGEILKSEFIK